MFRIPYVSSHTMKGQRNTSSKRYSNQKHRDREDIVGTIDNGQVLLTYFYFVYRLHMYVYAKLPLLLTKCCCILFRNDRFTAKAVLPLNNAFYICARKIIQRCRVLVSSRCNLADEFTAPPSLIIRCDRDWSSTVATDYYRILPDTCSCNIAIT